MFRGKRAGKTKAAGTREGRKKDKEAGK